jgi:RNA polymerase sigma-70 factor (ECF subfamily)
MTASIDTDLVRRAAGRDHDAMAALLTELRPGLVRYCRARLGRIGGGYTTADDVAQEVCLALLRALPRYRDVGKPFSAFVYGIAAHKVADAQRAAVRNAVTSPVAEIGDGPDTTEPGPEQSAERSDLARRLSGLLARLPETHREIVLLRVAVGLSADEVGEVVGMTAAAVRVTQSRALAKLRTLAGDALREVAA